MEPFPSRDAGPTITGPEAPPLECDRRGCTRRQQFSFPLCSKSGPETLCLGHAAQVAMDVLMDPNSPRRDREQADLIMEAWWTSHREKGGR